MKTISNNILKDILELREAFDSANELHFEAAAELLFRLANEIKNSNEICYKLVQWPESQMLMEHPRFNECLFVDNIDGHDDVGSSAYMCPIDLYEEIFCNEQLTFEEILNSEYYDNSYFYTYLVT